MHKIIITPKDAVDQRNMNGFKAQIEKHLVDLEIPADIEIEWGE